MLSFISADDPAIAMLGAGAIGGTNLYAYCNFDPINYVDPNGNIAFCLITALAGLLIGGGIGLAIGYWGYDVSWDEGLWKWGLIGAGVGGMVGFAVGAGVSKFATGRAFAGLTDIRIGLAARAGDIGKVAQLATHNKKAAEVVLGKYPEYINTASQNGSTYFGMNGKMWNYLEMKGFNMWDINRMFLDQQIALGKAFIFSSSYSFSGSYGYELLYLFGLL